MRGALLDLWKEARAEARRSGRGVGSRSWRIPRLAQRWQQARGKGGFRRGDWDTVLELIAASTIYTIKKHGPDRIVGFSPIPAMSMISYAAGARFLQLMGGVSLSFYDWYCDLPPASPEIWGEQTDVAESPTGTTRSSSPSMGSNLNMTRTPDCHFAAEARHNGTKMWVFSPDFSQVSKYADEWIAINAGQDGAWWMAVNHVLLKEFHHEKQTPYFLDYAKKYTDAPFLVELHEAERHACSRASCCAPIGSRGYQDVENGDWKFLMWDADDAAPEDAAWAASGFRWGKEKGKWNLMLKDGVDGSDDRSRR